MRDIAIKVYRIIKKMHFKTSLPFSKLILLILFFVLFLYVGLLGFGVVAYKFRVQLYWCFQVESFKYPIFLDKILFPMIAFCFVCFFNSSASQFYPSLRLRNFVILLKK